MATCMCVNGVCRHTEFMFCKKICILQCIYIYEPSIIIIIVIIVQNNLFFCVNRLSKEHECRAFNSRDYLYLCARCISTASIW